MTRAEFDTWIEQHYTDLLKVAKRKTRGHEPEDVVQAAVVAMLSRPGLARETPASIWPWAVAVVRERAKDAYVSAQRRSALTSEGEKIARAALVLGGSTRGGTQTPAAPTEDKR